MSKPIEKNITWFQVNNILPIVTSAIMIAASFFLLQQRVALIEQKIEDNNKLTTQKLETIVENTSGIKYSVGKLQEEHTTFGTRLTTLEVMHRK